MQNIFLEVGEMTTRKIMVPAISIVFLFTSLFFLGACSRGHHRIDASEISTRPGTERTPAEERDAEARRRAEAEEARRAESERQARLAPVDRVDEKFREEARAIEMEPVYFDFDSSDIKPEHRPLLEKKAAWLKANPEARVRIEGHCDDRGTVEYNLALGEKRAIRVMDYLVSLGVPAKKISTISYGEERPAVPGQDEEAWAKNRRAEFRLQ
jgi:peptidoglycan-associated lipoprotein